MTRRTFRVGLVLGLAAGALAAAAAAARRRPSVQEEVIAASSGIGVAEAATGSSEGAATGSGTATGARADGDAPPPVFPGDHDVVPGVDPTVGGSVDGGTAWTDPLDGGSCPVTHPVKAKMASGIFHLPGMAMYGRTRADRCYRDPEAAEADGLRRSSR